MDIHNGNTLLAGWNRVQKCLGRVKQASRYPPAVQHTLQGFAERVVVIDYKCAYFRMLHVPHLVNENYEVGLRLKLQMIVKGIITTIRKYDNWTLGQH